MTNKERDRILEQYTHTVEEFSSEEELNSSEEVRRFEEQYEEDEELPALMRAAKEKKIKFIEAASLKCN